MILLSLLCVTLCCHCAVLFLCSLFVFYVFFSFTKQILSHVALFPHGFSFTAKITVYIFLWRRLGDDCVERLRSLY